MHESHWDIDAANPLHSTVLLAPGHYIIPNLNIDEATEAADL